MEKLVQECTIGRLCFWIYGWPVIELLCIDSYLKFHIWLFSCRFCCCHSLPHSSNVQLSNFHATHRTPWFDLLFCRRKVCGLRKAAHTKMTQWPVIVFFSARAKAKIGLHHHMRRCRKNRNTWTDFRESSLSGLCGLVNYLWPPPSFMQQPPSHIWTLYDFKIQIQTHIEIRYSSNNSEKLKTKNHHCRLRLYCRARTLNRTQQWEI